jgi:long-chain fatty acid transport protein
VKARFVNRTLVLRSSAAVGVSGLLALLSTGQAHAAGTALDVQSARGTGMASTMTAHIDDSSAIYYNPAGLAQGKGLDAQIGITPIVAGYKYKSPSGTETSLPFRIVTPFNVYASYGITDDLTVGLGVNTPFGLTLKWPDDWEGRRQITTASNVNYNFNPTVAYRFGPVRVGAGFQLTR